MSNTPLLKRIKIKFNSNKKDSRDVCKEAEQSLKPTRPSQQDVDLKALEIFQYLVQEFYTAEPVPFEIATAVEQDLHPLYGMQVLGFDPEASPQDLQDMAPDPVYDDQSELLLPEVQDIDMGLQDCEDGDLSLDLTAIDASLPPYLLCDSPIKETFVPDPFPYTMPSYANDDVDMTVIAPPPPNPTLEPRLGSGASAKLPRERRERGRRDDDDDENTVHQCGECGKTFLKRRYLDRHQEIHDRKNSNKPPEFICDICGKGFIFKHRLDKHKKIHGEKMFSCDICGKSVSTNHGKRLASLTPRADQSHEGAFGIVVQVLHLQCSLPHPKR
ncbi:hypothetical protein HDU91_007085 [Kappamyces sp. JEL0680]|nr:hypothetical protein HDU91_007085 [Kappamyces sp. JEL0680]